jgi:hypothetical protein
VPWPGPNSDTFTPREDFLPRSVLLAWAPGGSGFQDSLYGIAGLLLAVDAAAPALKLPKIGRLGLER